MLNKELNLCNFHKVNLLNIRLVFQHYIHIFMNFLFLLKLILFSSLIILNSRLQIYIHKHNYFLLTILEFKMKMEFHILKFILSINNNIF